MSTRQIVLAAAALLGLVAISVGIVAHEGSLTGPGPVGAALRGARAALHGELEQRESALPAGRTRDDGLWRAYLAVVERELERGRVDAAVRAWHDAYSAALASRSWESMIAVGDAFRAIGRASGSVHGARMNAREAYLSALIRARREGSVDGALRSAEAFRALDARAVGEAGLRIAERLAAGDAEAQQRVREAWLRWNRGDPLS